MEWTVEAGSERGRGHPGDAPARFEQPLEDVKHGVLEFNQGASNVRLRGSAEVGGLYRAHFVGPAPRVRAEGGRVSVGDELGWFGWVRAMLTTGHAGEVELSTRVPWELRLRGGASKVDADLRGLEVTALSVEGGASWVDVKLPAPKGRVRIEIRCGASHVRILRPEGTAAKVRVVGGLYKLALDDSEFGAIGGTLQLETRGASSADDRYEIEIGGGASHLVVGRW